MSANDDHLSPRRITSPYTVPSPPPNGPFVPSTEEAKHRYYGLPSQPYFIARSSHDIWLMPTGMEAYVQPKELRRVGDHPLCSIWDGGVDVSMQMHNYLVAQEVQYTSLDPVRIGLINEAAPPIIWVGVEPGSLTAERGIQVAIGLRAFLLANYIKDVHIEIRESVVTTSAKMYKPVPASDPTVQAREAFSTTLGITICAEKTPDIQGTATLFFTVSSKPGKLFLLTARHVLFRIDQDNDHYVYHGSAARRNVLLLGTYGFEARIKDIEKEIAGTLLIIDHFKGRLELADKMTDVEAAQVEREDVQFQLRNAERATKHLGQFLIDIKRDWKDPKKRIIGHVVLSPPLIFNAGNGGFTQDFAVIEVDTTKIDATNFVGNVIDLGTEIPLVTLTDWMRPSNHQPSFDYPPDRLLRFNGTLSDSEMYSSNPKNVDDRNDSPTIMVVKHGYGTGLTVGCLNNLRSVVRKPFKTQPEHGKVLREVAVLPRSSKSGAFSEDGDSGAAVINGVGAVAGMLTGGSGSSEVSDCTYVTPITFLLECLEKHGFPANS